MLILNNKQSYSNYLHELFWDYKNPRFIIESGFKSKAGYNGTRRVISFYLVLFQSFFRSKTSCWGQCGQFFSKFAICRCSMNYTIWHKLFVIGSNPHIAIPRISKRTVSFDWFLSGLEWIRNLEFCLLKLLIFYQKVL